MAFSFKFPEFHETVLDNGLRLILLPDHEQEGLVAAMQFPFGRFCDEPGKEGVAESVIALLQKGTKQCHFDQFSSKLEFEGASLFAEVGEEHTGIGIRMLSKSSKELIPLFLDMVITPALDTKEFDRIKKEMVTALHAETVEPSIIANRHFFVELVGKGHPAGRFHSLDAIKKITLDDIKKFYCEHIGPNNAIMVVAGDFEIADFNEKYLKSIQQWGSEKQIETCYAPAVETSKKAFRLIDKNDTTQTTLVMGHCMPGELSPYRRPLALANYIFGAGNFSSRLMTSIRSKVGRTYGISSQIAAERIFGAFTISTSTQNNQLGAMVDAILEQYNEFYSNGITTAELDRAKKFAIGNMAFQLEGIGNIAEKLMWLRFYGYPDSYIEQFDIMLNDITLDNVNEAIKKHFIPEKLIIVAVGKRNEIDEQLKKFGAFSGYHFRDKI
jgi:zinc protease